MEDPRIISALFIFLKMAYYNVLINNIPMTRYFYEYQAPEPVEEIAVRLHELELDIQSSLDALFGEK